MERMRLENDTVSLDVWREATRSRQAAPCLARLERLERGKVWG